MSLLVSMEGFVVETPVYKCILPSLSKWCLKLRTLPTTSCAGIVGSSSQPFRPFKMYELRLVAVRPSHSSIFEGSILVTVAVKVVRKYLHFVVLGRGGTKVTNLWM